MRKNLSELLCFLCLFSFFALPVKATHHLGSTITYTNIAPGSYIVTFQEYSECSISAIPQRNLEIKAPGCNSGRFITMNISGQSRIGNPYCAGVVMNCFMPGTYKSVTYTGSLIFSASEQSCSDWIISWSECCRPETENVVGVPNAYTEAFLKLGSGFFNNSAQVNNLDEPMPVFCVNEMVHYSLNAYDPDCDSLSYELVAPLEAGNTAVTYKPISSPSGNTFINQNPAPPFNTTNNPQIATLPANLAPNYQPEFPLVSFEVNWGSQQSNIAKPYFYLDPVVGVLRFTPRLYVANSQTGGINRYLVAVKINEWRKVNGVTTLVGSVRRDLLFSIADCGANRLPSLTTTFPQPPLLHDTSYIQVPAGTQFNFQFTTNDLNINDTLLVETDVTSVLPGAQFTISPGAQPAGNFSWLATPFPNCDVVRYFRITVSDNACPIKGRQDFVIGVKVIANPTGRNEDLSFAKTFTAFPNPFTETVRFRFEPQSKAETIIIYNLLGQPVDQISIAGKTNGIQEVQWKNASKHAAGIYIAILISEDKTIQTLKFTKLQ